jgi:hypothetical protein
MACTSTEACSTAQHDSRVLTASGDQSVRLWDVHHATCIMVCQGHIASVKSVSAASPNGDVFASGKQPTSSDSDLSIAAVGCSGAKAAHIRWQPGDVHQQLCGLGRAGGVKPAQSLFQRPCCDDVKQCPSGVQAAVMESCWSGTPGLARPLTPRAAAWWRSQSAAWRCVMRELC